MKRADVKAKYGKLISLVKELDNISDTIDLQRIVFILKCLGCSFNERFKFEYLGPYSYDLNSEIEELSNSRMLLINGHVSYNRQVIDIHEDDEIQRYKDLIDKLKNLDSDNLYLLSSLFYLKHKSPSFYPSEKALKDKVSVLAPTLKDRVEIVYKEFDSLNEAQVA